MIDTDKYEGSKGRYFTGKLVDNYMNLQAEVKRLREQLVRAKKIIHSLAGQSDSAMMDYEDYIEGDEEE